MIIGILSIQMAGAAYCPLSPRDPVDRLKTLIKQTNSRLVFVQSMTQHLFAFAPLLINIDDYLRMDCQVNYYNEDHLSCVPVTPDNLAYVIFTSGSTGTP
ncbi:unnamed protein product, partial [Rotaria sordida]